MYLSGIVSRRDPLEIDSLFSVANICVSYAHYAAMFLIVKFADDMEEGIKLIQLVFQGKLHSLVLILELKTSNLKVVKCKVKELGLQSLWPGQEGQCATVMMGMESSK